MSKKKFIARLAFIVVAITLSQALAIEAIFYHVMMPTFGEMIEMGKAPAPLSVLVTAIFVIIAYYLYCRPLASFLDDVEKGNEISPERARAVQDRAMNVPNYLAIQSIIAYMACTPVITWMALTSLGWPHGTTVYGVVGAVIASLLAAPVYIFAGSWLVEPVKELSFEYVDSRDTARHAGRPISVRMKLVLAIIAVTGAAAGYTAVVGYAQTQNLINYIELKENMSEAGKDIDIAEDSRTARILESNLTISYLAVWISACAAALIIALLVSRELTRPVKVLKESADRFREGNYDKPVRLVSNDELAEMGTAMNSMMMTIGEQIRRMEAVVENLRSGVEKVNETSSHIMETSSEQSAGATQQATAVQESSVIAEEMVATNKHIAEQAERVEKAASSTLEASKDGEDRLDNAMNGFNDIAAQVDSIAESLQELEESFMNTYMIVELVEEISGQTELLSLNAELEAAGAGEYGKRFSVVAGATRDLAVKSADAAQQIKVLVENIQRSTVESSSRAREGTVKVFEWGKSMRGVTSSLKDISRLAGTTSDSVGEISVSTREQSSATQQLASSMEEVKEVAARVEEGAKNVESSIIELKTFVDGLSTGME